MGLREITSYKYLIEGEGDDRKIRIPFSALSGVGGNAANAVYEAVQERLNKGDTFTSIEDFQQASGCSKTIVQTLQDLGAFGDLPESDQLSLF